jgi:hypothetical protein
MNRKEFLRAVGASSAVAFAGPTGLAATSQVGAAQHSGGQNEHSETEPALNATANFRGKRLILEYAGLVSAAPEAVFPLLCPVREYEWLDGWNCVQPQFVHLCGLRLNRRSSLFEP